MSAYNAASPQLKRMETLLVRLTTDEGLQGWGEAFGHLVNPASQAALGGLVGQLFLGARVGADPASFAASRLAAEQALHAFGRTGPVVYALSAIDTALWDLSAQIAGQPLYRHLGGRRDRIEAYASLVSYGNRPAEVARQVQRAQAAGYRRIKLHETEYPAISAARQALPADIGLMVDVNCPWNLAEAETRIRGCRDLQLGWIEEPLWPPDDIDGLASLRRRGTPIAAGENVSGVEAFRQHFQQGAIDVAQPSVAKIGGISAMREVFAMAARHGVQVMPHCFYYGAGMLATAHLAASLPAPAALEVPFLQWPRPLYPDFPREAEIRLPDQPGLGWVPDPGVLNDYRIDGCSLRLDGENA
ncbi:enolase superfamily enzyme related to L-alanine-DL-glutamate epimerase [Frateuria aurantia DSM 6220]|uniref:Enolase superfamily enzyme related to L-alanine-DL-glutamate epimerase n=2 Tax=Frateuria aurantia TaxID=81475 RepID=H8L0W8_FRAAD|nr:enolase superfamily enzyme related to L-alanine-DL-glutamate epimerase [Frateuria aurantia DSM 6220]